MKVPEEIKSILFFIVVTFIAYIIFRSGLTSYQIMQHGQLVTMNVELVNKGGAHNEVYFRYEGQRYHRNRKDKSRYGLTDGQLISVYYQPGCPDTVMPDDKPMRTMVITVIVYLAVMMLMFGTDRLLSRLEKPSKYKF